VQFSKIFQYVPNIMFCNAVV